ncbi:hypothetical protein WJX73_006757 [Symbiochloris irregularis]|uniref:RecF/RecN/SMC N-terminal domain-containing protein n=1 Tax=Symbiochloris irregularis TaxID=706552 RepID=A0AAW1PQ72_9CHLO
MIQSTSASRKRKSPDGSSPRRRSSRRYEDTGERDLAAEMLEENEHEETGALIRKVEPGRRRRRAAERDVEIDEDEDMDEPRSARARDASADVESPRATPDLQGDGRGSAGQLKSLKVENFMCHENLEMTFGPHVNFISGQNGSGKSAVLQALQFCLGLSARHTGRATSAKQLVRTGASYMKAQVTLWNLGVDAYLPNYYGECITIERKVSAQSGTSTWTIYKADGSKAQATSTKEVLAMCDYFNCDASNPAICLTQDTARTFSGTASAKGKYEVYMEALHFTKIISRLHEARGKVSDMSANLQDFEQRHQTKAEELAEVKKTLEALAEVKDWKEQVAQVKLCQAWADQYINEARLAGLQNKLAMRIPTARQQLQVEIDSVQQKVQEMDAEYERQKEAFDQHSERISAIAREKQGLQQGVADARHQLTKIQGQAKGLDNEIANNKNARDMVIEAIQAAEDKLAKSSETAAQRKAQHNSQVRQLATQQEAAEAGASAARQGLKEAEANKAQKQERVDSAGRDARDASSNLRMLNTRLQELKNAHAKPVVAFGGNQVDKLLTEIQRKVSQFHRPPIGPVGAFLSLDDDHWATAVEASIGTLFNQFLVHDEHDMKLLQSINTSCRGPSLTIGKRSFDLPPHNMACNPQPSPALTTIYRILQIKEEGQRRTVLQNFLLDKGKVERVALVQDWRQGFEVLKRERNTLGSAWDHEGWHGVIRGQSETSFPKPWNVHPRLQKDVSQLRAMLEGQRQQATAADQQAKARLGAARQEAREADQGLQHANKAVRGAETQRRQVSTQMTQLQASQQQEMPVEEDQEDTMNQLADELQDCEARLREATRQKEDRMRAVEEAKTAVDAAKRNVEAKEASIRTITEENEAAENAMKDAQDRKIAVHRELEKTMARQVTLEELAASLESNIEEAKQDVSMATERGSEVCTQEEEQAALDAIKGPCRLPDEPGKRKEKLDKLAKDLDSKIRSSERRAGRSLEDLEADRDILEDVVGRQTVQLGRAEKAYKLLSEGHNFRRREATRVRDEVEFEVDKAFNKYLKRRRHCGRLVLNYRDHELDMEVEVDAKSHGQKATNMKSLSGGERSFSTLAFIMAMGKYINAPFHCLDEFDVFLDAQNRQMAIRLLLECARDAQGTQLVLLSPQDVNSIRHAIDEVHAAAVKGNMNIPAKDEFATVVEMRPARVGNGSRGA